PTWSISGTISPAGGAGSTVSLSGAAKGTATADASGNYIFTGLANGAFTVTPSKNGLTFSPPNQSVTVNGANVTGINFIDQVAPAAISLVQKNVNGNESSVSSISAM